MLRSEALTETLDGIFGRGIVVRRGSAAADDARRGRDNDVDFDVVMVVIELVVVAAVAIGRLVLGRKENPTSRWRESITKRISSDGALSAARRTTLSSTTEVRFVAPVVLLVPKSSKGDDDKAE